MKKRIGVLTYFTDIPYFNDVNPGMDLQAFSVYSALKDAYPDAEVEMIRYHSWFAIWRIYLSSMTFSTLVQDFVQFWKYFRFQQIWKVSRKHLVSGDPEKAINFINKLNYDAIYVGSDTLLELFRAPKDEITAYWLNPKIKGKKFMIAASARDTSVSHLSTLQKEKLNDAIRVFDKLGVRDKATYELVSHFTPEGDDRLKIIPDPTFYMDVDTSHAKEYLRKKGILQKGKPIICFHLLKNNSFAFDLANKLREEGNVIVSLRPAKYADYVLKDLSPLEFSGIFSFFSLTLTHRFHDSVFSLKNLCPLILFLPGRNYENEKGESKQSFLMETFGLKESCFINDIEKLDDKLLFDKIKESQAIFKEKNEDIKKQLIEYKVCFSDYVNETKNVWIQCEDKGN